jgi:hypothetical protein
MFQKSLLSIGLSAVLLSACASAPPVPSVLVPAGESAVGRIAARGVQIYECRAKAGAPGGTEWAFVGPEADLFDASGYPAGKHYAGPHWEAGDGSKVVGSVKARVDAPVAGAIPWLLLTAKSVGNNGKLSKVTSIQRVNTVGGVAPAAGCDATTIGKGARVPYSADYVLFAA